VTQQHPDACRTSFWLARRQPCQAASARLTRCGKWCPSWHQQRAGRALPSRRDSAARGRRVCGANIIAPPPGTRRRDCRLLVHASGALGVTPASRARRTSTWAASLAP